MNNLNLNNHSMRLQPSREKQRSPTARYKVVADPGIGNREKECLLHLDYNYLRSNPQPTHPPMVDHPPISVFIARPLEVNSPPSPRYTYCPSQIQKPQSRPRPASSAAVRRAKRNYVSPYSFAKPKQEPEQQIPAPPHTQTQTQTQRQRQRQRPQSATTPRTPQIAMNQRLAFNNTKRLGVRSAISQHVIYNHILCTNKVLSAEASADQPPKVYNRFVRKQHPVQPGKPVPTDRKTPISIHVVNQRARGSRF